MSRSEQYWAGYQEIPVMRKLFIVPVAENNHGKTLVLRSVVRLARGQHRGQIRDSHKLMLASGQVVSAIVFPSSFQEQLHREPGLSIEGALRRVDKNWLTYDLIIFPSHENPADVESMLLLAHRHGYDAIIVNFTRNEGWPTSEAMQECFQQNWEQRWIIRNESMSNFSNEGVDSKRVTLTKSGRARIDMLAAHFWARIGTALLG